MSQKRKTITISEEAYNVLKTLKKEDETFTDLIDRLVQPLVLKKGMKICLTEIVDAHNNVPNYDD